MSQVDHTTTTAPANGPPAAATTPDRARRSEELVYLFFVLWTMIGLCLDGWAHRYQPELESFFTPWHAVFYTGFIGGSAWLARMIITRRPDAVSLRASIPDGYQLAVLGLGLFAIGGVGDGFWHTILGVETGIDALLSPTHLLMLFGMLAGATAPIRAAWRDPALPIEVTSLRRFLPVVLSAGVATTGVAFFFLYANGFSNWRMQNPYIPDQSDAVVTGGILSTLASTVILLGPVMFILRRWRPPAGTFTVIFGIVGVFMAGLDAYRYPWQILAPVAGGLVADWVVRRPELADRIVDRSGGDNDPAPPIDQELRRRAWVLGLAVPLVMWTVSTAATAVAWAVRWPPELWVGQIVMAMLLGFGLAIMSHPPSRPRGLTEPASGSVSTRTGTRSRSGAQA
ncbi:MAG: hypothetical protein ACR2QK_24200 [Acidimicrobiales bacterium]